jgi:hypothetical protein
MKPTWLGMPAEIFCLNKRLFTPSASSELILPFTVSEADVL